MTTDALLTFNDGIRAAAQLVRDRGNHELANTIRSLEKAPMSRAAPATPQRERTVWPVEVDHQAEINRLAGAIHIRSYTTVDAAYEAARIAYDLGCRLPPHPDAAPAQAAQPTQEAEVLAELSKPFHGGSRVTNCVSHMGLEWSGRPEDCKLCFVDLQNQFAFAVRVNEFLNERIEAAKVLLARKAAP